MARIGDSNFRSRLNPRFNPKILVLSTRRSVTCGTGTFVIDQPFVIEDALKLGFTLRRIKILYDRKFFRPYPKDTDLQKMVAEGKKISAPFVEKFQKEEARNTRIANAAKLAKKAS